MRNDTDCACFQWTWLHSDWLCTVPDLAKSAGRPPLRLGLRYARGLREDAGRAIVRARETQPFASIDDLALQVPELRKDEINRLAEIGALNGLNELDRRGALWQAPLLEHLEEKNMISPLLPMNVEERLQADYHGTGVTVGRHPMAYRRAKMNALGVTPAIHLAEIPNGGFVRIAGSVIVRQRPGTANGFVFLSLEDETGVMNAIIASAIFDRFKLEILGEAFLLIHGPLQNLDGVISVKAARIDGLRKGVAAGSHDFHQLSWRLALGNDAPSPKSGNVAAHIFHRCECSYSASKIGKRVIRDTIRT